MNISHSKDNRRMNKLKFYLIIETIDISITFLTLSIVSQVLKIDELVIGNCI